MFAVSESRAPRPCLSNEPVTVERAPSAHKKTLKRGFNETVHLYSILLGASGWDLDLSVLSTALKAKQGLVDLKKLSSTTSLGMGTLDQGCKQLSGYPHLTRTYVSQPLSSSCVDNLSSM